MQYAFIKAQEVAFPVNVMCRLLEVSRSGCYAWKERPEAPLDAAKVTVAAEIEAAHRRSRGTYGSPRIHRDLRPRGVRINRKRVERLMREKGAEGCSEAPVPVHHRFPAHASDCSERAGPELRSVPARSGLGGRCDVHRDGRRLAAPGGHARPVLSSRGRLERQRDQRHCTCIRGAAARLGVTASTGWTAASHDRGSPYAALAYTAILRQHGIIASMSRAGDCCDNAVVESFFGTLKAELVGGQVYPSRAVATAAIADYIGNFYNPQRRHPHLQYLSPIEFESRAQTAAFAA